MPDQIQDLIRNATGFDWDESNRQKIWNKHKVSVNEAEQVFVNPPFLIYYDALHSQDENRYAIYGETNAKRRLCIIFTIRGKSIRAVSARGFHQKELRKYQGRKAV